MFESRGMRLVRESVGNKSAKLYRPYIKLRSIQSDVSKYRIYITKNYKQIDGIAELNKGTLNYSEQNKLGEGSYGNVYHGNFEGMSVFVKQIWSPSLRQMFYGIYKPSDIINISLTSSQ